MASVPVKVYVTVEVGEKATPLVTPFVHVYVVAVPLPLNVTEAPLHITELLAVAVTVGREFTVTELTAVLVQPVVEFVPVNV